MHRSVLRSIPRLCLVTLVINFPLIPSGMLKNAVERVLQFKCLDPADQSYRPSELPAAIWCGKTDRRGC
jgi:hypothetical protein